MTRPKKTKTLGKELGGLHVSPPPVTHPEEEAKIDAARTEAEVKSSSGLAAKLQNATKPVRKVSGDKTPTAEQQAILDLLSGDLPDQLIIEAGAGAGKTSTLRMIGDILIGNGQYTAFNTSLVEESKAKFQGTRVACNTTHSLAFRAEGKRFAHRLGGQRVKSERVAEMLGIEPLSIGEGEKERVLQPAFLASQVMGAIRRFCQSADREVSGGHFRYLDGIDMPTEDGQRTYINNEKVREYLLPFAEKAWKDLSNEKGQLPFQHDHYVKIWQLNHPVIAADYVLCDECFPAGTLVETHLGNVPIEHIAERPEIEWRVLTRVAEGKTLRYSRVLRAYKTPTKNPLVRISHAEGSLTCTANHPIWIEGKEWIPAGLIKAGDGLLLWKAETKDQETVQELCNQEVTRSEICGHSRSQAKLVEEGNSVSNLRQTNERKAENVFHEVRQPLEGAEQIPNCRGRTTSQDFDSDETSSQGDSESNGTFGNSSQSICDYEAPGRSIYGTYTRRKWKGTNSTGASVVPGTSTNPTILALEPRICCLEWETENGNSTRLQDRYSICDTQDCRGIRREFSQEPQSQECRRKERPDTQISQVVCVEVQKRTSNGESHDRGPQDYQYVYTLSVESGNYFANGVLVKNCQDLSPVLLDILQQQKCLIVLVGDSAQQIYEWRGAVNALAAFPDAPRQYLSQSFRFGEAIAQVANAVLETLDEPTQLRLKGLPSIPSKVTTVEQPTCILCRTNAVAVGTMLNAISENKRPFLIGGGADVIAFVNGAQALQEGMSTSHAELACFKNWAEVQEYVKLDEGEDLRLMVKLIDSFGCQRILDALKNMPKEQDADLVISTAHKSKGREWDKVQLAADFPTKSKCGDSDRRLIYVAVTRAKLELDVSLCPFFSGQDSLDISQLIKHPANETPTSNTMSSWPEPTKKVQVEFTWAKSKNGSWLIRGPVGYEGKEVDVTRKDGSSARKVLGRIETEFQTCVLYRVSEGGSSSRRDQNVCAECGRPGQLVEDSEDGLLKHYGCCDIPPQG